MTTLDDQYMQVLLEYPADNVPWHQGRLLRGERRVDQKRGKNEKDGKGADV